MRGKFALYRIDHRIWCACKDNIYASIYILCVWIYIYIYIYIYQINATMATYGIGIIVIQFLNRVVQSFDYMMAPLVWTYVFTSFYCNIHIYHIFVIYDAILSYKYIFYSNKNVHFLNPLNELYLNKSMPLNDFSEGWHIQLYILCTTLPFFLTFNFFLINGIKYIFKAEIVKFNNRY